MSAWSKYPLARLLLAFVIGIFMAYYAISPILPFYIVLPLVLIVSIAGYNITRKKMHHRWYSAILLFCFVILGIVHTQTFTNLRQQIPNNICSNTTQKMILLVNEIPIEKEKSVKIVGKVTQVQQNETWINTNTQILLYIQKDTAALNITYGDKLLINAQVKELLSAQNPHAFDYKRYLNIKNIYYQAYCNTNQWRTMERNQGNKILMLSARIRNVLLHILQQSKLHSKEYGIITSMLLGCDDKLDADLSQQYATAGVSHILCVSGMHVGVIFLIINSLLAFMNRNKYSKQLKCVIVLLCVWLYACITGLSPSVMRASSMFTFVCIGQLSQQKSNTFNSLFASMLFLLIINPMLIFEIGFQFSYLAVFGIVWIANLMKDIFHSNSTIVEYLWGIVCVSIVAQLFTAPLSMYYFHRFPNYFIFPNIVVITMAPLIIGCGIAVLCTQWLPPLFYILSKLLSLMIQMVNTCIESINSLPYSATEGISFSAIQTIMLYLMIVSVIIFFVYKQKSHLWIFCCAVTIFFSIELKRQLDLFNHEEIVFYHTSSSVLVDYFHGKHCYNYYTDSNSLEYSVFSCDNHRYYNRTKHFHAEQDKHYFQLGQYSCLVLDTMLISCDTPCLNVDFLVLSNNQNYNIAAICQCVQFDMLIIDNSFSTFRKEKLLQQCHDLQIAYHDLQKGAMIISFPQKISVRYFLMRTLNLSD